MAVSSPAAAAVSEHLLLLLLLPPPLLLLSHCMHNSSALKARTSRAPGAKGSFKLAVSHYLDLPDLERWLAEWREALLSEAGVNWDTEHGGAAQWAADA